MSAALSVLALLAIASGLGLIVAVWVRHHVAWYGTFPHSMRKTMVQLGLVRRIAGRPDEKPRLVRKGRKGDIWELSWKAPVGVTSEKVLANRAAIEEALDCSLECWSERGLLHMRVGVAPIPDFHALEDGKASTKGALVVHLGMGREGSLEADLSDPPHTLIGGTSGRGKSTLLQSVIVQLAQRYDPSYVQFLLVDLKGAVDMSTFDGLPHLYCPVVGRLEDAAAELQGLVEEQARRQDMLRTLRCPNIGEYNRSVPQLEQRLPYIVVVIDEFAELLPKGWKGKEYDMRTACWNAVSSLARMGRASGIHALLATQRPDADVVDPQTRANCGRVIATRCTTKFNSEVLLGPGNTAAWRLADRPGLAVYRVAREVQVQLAYMPAADVEAAVQELRLRYGMRPGLPAGGALEVTA